MDEACRDVVVMGWWAQAQRRVDFVRLLQRELALGLREAKRQLERTLEGDIWVLPVTPAERAVEVAQEIQLMGAEVFLLGGHLSASGDPKVRRQFAQLVQAFEAVQSNPSLSAREAALRVRTLGHELRPPARAASGAPRERE